MLQKVNVLGAVVAILFNVSAILVFVCRLLKRPDYGHLIGYFEFLLLLPLGYLLLSAPGFGRPTLYYVQAGLMVAWLLVEMILDYILKVDFRHDMRIVIPYVMLFFAGSGGMLGIAGNAGRGWTIPAALTFLVMAVVTFVQRSVTGM